VRDGIGERIYRQAIPCGLDRTNHMAVNCSEPAELDRLDRSVAEDHVRQRKLYPLHGSDEARIQRKLMNERRLELTREFCVEQLVCKVSQLGWGRHAAEEVGATHPTTVEERRLEDQPRARPHRSGGIPGCPLELTSVADVELVSEVNDVAVGVFREVRQLFALVPVTTAPNEVCMGVSRSVGRSAFAPRDG
jgi:hypothetical protein